MKNIKIKKSWPKIAVALLLSNVFFYLLFSGNSEMKQDLSVPQGWVEVQMQADMLTPFQKGKKITLINRQMSQQLNGMLEDNQDTEGRITILVKENEASALILYQNWEIIPFIHNLKLPKISKGDLHEIRY